jgi:predicted metal-dependent phosphoesterase TrpH
MKRLIADMHIHTALSPCASPEMTPDAIVREAARKGLAVIAVCDHNTAGNVRAVAAAAAGIPGGPVVIAGIEITTVEEVHVLGWFPTADSACAAAGELEVDSALASAASQLTLSQTVDLIHRHGGLAVAAHVDRRSFSVPGQLGFIPPDVPFDGLEISAAGAARGRAAGFAALGLPLVSSSDCHFLDDMGAGTTQLDVAAPCFDEIAMALGMVEGRGCTIA